MAVSNVATSETMVGSLYASTMAMVCPAPSPATDPREILLSSYAARTSAGVRGADTPGPEAGAMTYVGLIASPAGCDVLDSVTAPSAALPVLSRPSARPSFALASGV